MASIKLLMIRRTLIIQNQDWWLLMNLLLRWVIGFRIPSLRHNMKVLGPIRVMQNLPNPVNHLEPPVLRKVFTRRSWKVDKACIKVWWRGSRQKIGRLARARKEIYLISRWRLTSIWSIPGWLLMESHNRFHWWSTQDGWWLLKTRNWMALTNLE